MTAAVAAVVRSPDELAALLADWDRLYAESEPRNPFLSAAWNQACWETTAAGTELFIVTLRAEDRLVGLAPLCIERRSGFRVLRFIAEGRGDYLGFLCPDDRAEVERQLVEAILERSGEWDLAVLKQLVSDYSGLDRVELPAAAQAHSVDAGKAPFMAADTDWEGLHGIGPSWLKRTRKRLSRFLRDGWLFERFTGAEAAARLDDVASIEARSWKARDKVMRLQPGAGQELFRRAFETLAEMQLWIASIDGRPVAYEIDFTLGDRLWIYQLGYDEAFHKASVGSFLGYSAIEHAWKAGAREYDYMSGEDSYKADRTTASRAIRHLAIHPSTLRGRAAYLMLVAPRWTLKEMPAARAAYQFSTGIKRRIFTR